MRIAIHGGGLEADVEKRTRHDLAALRIAKPGALHVEAFADDVGDGQTRRQRAVGVLKHDLHVLAQRPDGPQLEVCRCAG